MKVLVFGAGGQIGREVCRAAWPPRYKILPLDRGAVDIAKNTAVTATLAREVPDLVINLAAYTAVDRAESEPEAAWAVNCAGTAHIAAASSIEFVTGWISSNRPSFMSHRPIRGIATLTVPMKSSSLGSIVFIDRV